MKSIKVLIIDDSALVRQTLTEIISSDPQLEVIGTAANPYIAAQKIKSFIPDVITLDIEMPQMNGLTFLKSLMQQYPIPVVIISSLTEQGSSLALRAIDMGAVEVVAKSEIRYTKEHLEECQIRVTDAIKAAHLVTVKRVGQTLPKEPPSVAKPKPPGSTLLSYGASDRIIAIGASTGGTEALRFLLKQVPANTPAILITQHMPAGFTRSFADSLNTLCEVEVKEAVDGERVMRGHVYIAPGGRHMEIYRSGSFYFIRVLDGTLVNRHKPSVDVLFNSVAKHAGSNATGILLTGMGKDGAQGLLKMREAGAHTVAQDEKSCVVFGMPKEAIHLNAADKILSLDAIASYVCRFK